MLIRQMATKEFEKEYMAILEGILVQKTGSINAPISRKENSIIERVVSPNGEHAVTHYSVLKEYSNFSLVSFKLETGRTHQIRAQAAFHNFPLLGDTAYSGIKLNEKQDFFLHAIKLEFPTDNPINLPKSIITSIPKQWIDFLNKTSNDKMLLNKNIEDII